MADSASLVAVAVGGVLALTGTVVSQVFGLVSGCVDRRHQRAVKQRERLERIADSVSASLKWFAALTRCRSLDDFASTPIPPEARQAAMLAHLYFPSLIGPTKDYVDGLIRYYHFAGDCMQEGIPTSLGAKMAMAVDKNPEMAKCEEEPVILRQRLDDAIAAEAKKYSHV